MPVNESSEDYELHFETEEFYEICKFSEVISLVNILALQNRLYRLWMKLGPLQPALVYGALHYFQHVRCAAPLYRNFTYENCNCDPGATQ